MVAAKIVEQHGKEMDVAVFDLPHFCEGAVKLADNLGAAELAYADKGKSRLTHHRVLPVQLSNKL